MCRYGKVSFISLQRLVLCVNLAAEAVALLRLLIVEPNPVQGVDCCVALDDSDNTLSTIPAASARRQDVDALGQETVLQAGVERAGMVYNST